MASNNDASTVRCEGCGFDVEVERVVLYQEYTDEVCDRCVDCDENPRLRESYRRGFNAGLDAMVEAMTRTARDSNLRRR